MLKELRQWWERRYTSGLRDPQPWLKEALGIEGTLAGIDVSADTALKCTAVFGCVRVLSESIAGLPLHLYRRDGDSRERATDHPLYHVLHDQPNSFQTSYEFRALQMVHLLLHGNCYAEIVRDKAGQVTELWPISPDTVTLTSESGKIAYKVSLLGDDDPIPAERMLHIRALTTDAATGISPISAARQSIGVSLAAEKYAAVYFGQGMSVGGALSMPEMIGADKAQQIRDAWNDKHKGVGNFHRIAVISGGATFTPFKLSNVDAEFLATRRFGVEDVARVFRVPSHMLGELGNASYNNVDSLDRQFAKYSLTPWTTNIEQAMAMKLLGPRQRANYFIEHDMNGLLRGDYEARMRGYSQAIYSGTLSPNEARRMENLPAREGGDVFLQPVNVAPSPYNPQQPGVNQNANN